MKKLLLLLLIISVLAFSACGGDENTADTDGGTSSVPSEQLTQSESSEAPTEEDTQDSEAAGSDTQNSDGKVTLPKVDF